MGISKEEISVSKAIRWRIITLQAVMVLVLAGAAAFAYGLGTFTTTQIHDELAAQQIYFPGADQIKAGGALDPATFPQEIRDQAGKQVEDLRLNGHIEGGNRFIRDDDLGLKRERAGDGDALTLSA